ncbi:MAG TPA: molybdopterin cofactor-binding domain-containing protein [Planctomycetota bacterium]|nr:molybdopterin cofactor-binding domain-containing protein [Planctomycetota bacterium]
MVLDATPPTAKARTDAPWHHDKPKDELRVIGKPIRKVDARSKVSGLTQFADDLVLPRMLHMKLLRSTMAHAEIVRIDTTKAEALAGVKGVLTGKDLPIPFGILPVSQDEHALCPDRVRFVGDPVVAIAATEEEIAWDACRLVEVEYKELRTIGGIHEAAANDEPRLHDYGVRGNIHRLENLEFGDLADGFAKAEHVREDTFFFEGNTHLPMEQHATLAHFDKDGKLTVWSSTQTPHYLHKALARTLDPLPAHHIRVIACPNGGGFGGKSDPFNHEIAAAKMSMLTGRPVKICLTREEVFWCHRGRHPVLMRARVGVTKTGRITALDFHSFLDGGAYGSYGTASTFYTGALQTVTYAVDNYHFRGARFFTNKPPCGPKRGHGTPQPRFALEVQLDKIACDLGLDPAQMRLDNLAPRDSLTANFLRIGSMGLGTCIEKVVEGSGWKTRRTELGRQGRSPLANGRFRGLGLACSSYLSGAGLPIYWNGMPHSGVQLKLDRSGLVTAFCGSTDIGQGSDSVLGWIIGEVLGIDPLGIKVVTADTDLTPVDLGSYSSRVTVMTGNAAMQAAERARDIIARGAAEKLGVPAGRLVFADARVFDAEEPGKGMTFQEAICAAEARFGTIGTVGSYSPPASAAKFRGGGVGPSPSYSYSACVVEVEVDAETGVYTVPKVWMAHDIGRALNAAVAMGQIEGSVYMGLGEAMMEEMAYRDRTHKGQRIFVHKIPSLLEYKSPTTLEMPEVVTYVVEDPDRNGPFGAKEVGQGPLLPMMPAVANAIFDAVGVRVDEIPVSPEKVFAALMAKKDGKEARYGPANDETGVPAVDFGESLKIKTPWQGGDGTAWNEPKRTKKAAK